MRAIFAFLIIPFLYIRVIKEHPFSHPGIDINRNISQTTSIYDFKVLSLNGDTIDFSAFRGKKLLIVNTASKCGFTPQYKELEQLYKQYQNKLVIVGFPANNFFSQEPGSNETISGIAGTSGTDVWAVTVQGSILRYDGQRFGVVSREELPSLQAIASVRGQLFIAGALGTILHKAS